MPEGKIYYAQKRRNYCLKFVGDVRVTLCTSLSRYIQAMFDCGELNSLLIDLTLVKGLDSTTLGFMAKVAIYAQSLNVTPVIICIDPSIYRLLESMGFDDIFKIKEKLQEPEPELEQMTCDKSSEDDARKKVIEAHQILMSMNKKNMKTFSGLVSMLEKEADFK